MKFVIAGASGLLGTAWTGHLEARGHQVTRLVRREAGPGESQWHPHDGKVDLGLVDQADVVANLAGSSLAGITRSKKFQRRLFDSRVQTTATLAQAVAKSDRKPALLAQNGIAAYGDRGDDVVTEADPTDADTLMGRVAQDWQAATLPAVEAGARVIVMRTAVVLDRTALAVKAMRLPFVLGLGGRIGDGRQYFSTISLRDWLRAATHLAEGDGSGAYNLTGPNATTNAEFTQALADHLHRPAFLRVPAFAVKAALGPLSPELLGSIRLEPRRLLDDGFVFEDPTLADRISASLG